MAEEGHTPDEAQLIEAAQTPGEAEEPEAVEMAGMPPMLAYTLRAPIQSGRGTALIRIGQGPTAQVLTPAQPKDWSYWIVILDANKPGAKLQEWVVQDNKTIPSNLDQYMKNPAYLFAVVTQVLGVSGVPQGAFYDYLVAHGAGRELQKLEQISSYTVVPYGLFPTVSYVLTGQCGGTPSNAYERSSFTDATLLLLSLMPMPNGQPPYSICDSYTFVTR
jgi:hypothetical protein